MDVGDFRADPVPRPLQVVPGLEAHPELVGRAEEPGQPQRGVRGDGALAVHDLVDPARRYVDEHGQLVLRDAERGEELLKEDLARVDRFE
ncbi:hypothetical protein HNR02_006571 [Amycolatopsis endophytica]|uniref:Uncharacterized protein n=1 Tax=Amycolatopsis endophytica TaxID=860233 RepID=A0A853BFC3_9PSEU|nr:hypothetical protein [Amycolatopsis endophytica]